MADKKTKEKTEKIEREYTISLRRETNKVPSYQKTPKAVKAIKEFIARHMKVYDRDLRKIRIDRHLNQEMWYRGIKKPLLKIKVKAIKDGDIVRVELAEVPERIKFQKLREEKLNKKTEDTAKKKTEEKKKGEEIEQKSQPEVATEKKEEETKEKKEATVEAMEKIEKESAKKMKHEASGKQKMPKHQFRKALQK